MLPRLSLDIQVEIIKVLPVKSLIRFRSVCKAWKSLIDSPQFIAGYNLCDDRLMIRYSVGFRQEKEVKYVCFVDDDSFPQQKFALTVPPVVQATTTIIGISHGLLCVYGCFQEQEPDDSIRKLSKTEIAFFWNPAIRKSIGVVVPNMVHPPFNSVIGFGVCPDTKDPMLVKITYIYNFTKIESTSCIPFQVMVFTLSSGEWTTLSCSSNLPRKSIEVTCFQTVVGQFIYWLAYDYIVVNGGFRYHTLIMSFNMSTQEFREVQLPDSLSKLSKLALTISKIRESLAVIKYTKGGFCDVWMMEHGDFTKLFTINLPNALVSWTLGFRKSGEAIVKMQNDNKDYDSPLALYEPCSQHFKDLGIRGNGYSFSVKNYTESLLLLDHQDGHIVRCEDLTFGTD